MKGLRRYDTQDYWDSRYKRLQHNAFQPNNTDGEGSVSLLKKRRMSMGNVKRSVTENDDQDDVTTDWYYSYTDIQPLLEMLFETKKNQKRACKRFNQLKASAQVLDIGCGVSTMLEDMYRDGWSKRLVAIDYTPTAVLLMKQRCPNIECYQLDIMSDTQCRKLFAEHTFDIIIDKATSDGLLCSEESAKRTPSMYRQIARLLKPGGLFLMVSVIDAEHGAFSDYILKELLSYVDEAGDQYDYNIDIHTTSDYGDQESGPNVFFIRKHTRARRKRNNQTSIYEQIESTHIKLHEHDPSE